MDDLLPDTTNEPPLHHWLPKAFGTLALSGFFGAAAGLSTGMLIGSFFGLIGFLPGFVFGIPVGFTAALFGAAIGGYRGWTFSGGIGGFLGGSLLFHYTTGSYLPHLNEFVWFLLLTVPPTIAGLSNGYRAAQGIYRANAPFSRLLDPLRNCLIASRFYELPLELRLLLAAVNLAIGALIGAFILACISPVFHTKGF
jgi:hypothetical protein